MMVAEKTELALKKSSSLSTHNREAARVAIIFNRVGLSEMQKKNTKRVYLLIAFRVRLHKKKLIQNMSLTFCYKALSQVCKLPISSQGV